MSAGCRECLNSSLKLVISARYGNHLSGKVLFFTAEKLELGVLSILAKAARVYDLPGFTLFAVLFTGL